MRSTTRGPRPLMRVPACLLLLALSACGGGGGGNDDGGGDTPTPPTASKYDVTVTRTKYGVPHINAKDFGSLGYGYGYAFAEDNLCTMLDDYITVRGERAQYFGRAGSYSIPSVPVTAPNVDSDFFWKLIADAAAIKRFKDGAAPDVQLASLGYVDGFNRYIRELKNGEHPGRHVACAGKPWLQEISEDDMYRRYLRLAVIASASALTNEIATAQPPLIPPTASAAAGAAQDAINNSALGKLAKLSPGDVALENSAFGRLRSHRFGSNMYAIGKNGSSTGQPIVFGNPHFPWNGSERLYLAHLTIPGRMDIMGVGLYGVPLALIGFNDHFAWSHTVSTAYRFTLYQLALNPLKPTQYFYEGKLKDMEAVPLSVNVTEADGSSKTETRTLYRTMYGPMLEISALGLPVLGWTTTTGFTMRDANYENTRLINQFYRWNLATSLDEFKQLHKEILGTPWVNTVASGPDGRAYYGDVTVVPNVSDAKVAACKTNITSVLVGSLVPGLPLLFGHRADCQWDTDADAPAPGIFGPSHLPTLERDDYVHNSNDSYWLSNPAQPLTGYARIIGDEGTTRTLRTRLGILQMQRRFDGSDGRPGKTFDLPTLQQTVLSSRIYSGELARDSAVANLCSGSDVTAACAVLKTWDLADNTDSVGGHIWREFFRNASAASNVWSTAFDVNDPVNTPRDLNTSSSAVKRAFTDGVAAVADAGFAVDAKFGTIQHSAVNNANGAAIPVIGGEGFEGAFTIASSGAIGPDGYPVDFGNSYIQTVTWEGSGSNAKVHAEGFVTYSESTDPANPHYADFTQAYAQKAWYRFPFHADEVEAAKETVVQLSE
jgi:acyl-homoserine-lactone acylase